MQNKTTNHFLDCLKGIACIGVVFIHVHFPGFLGDIVWRLAQFAVPIFFMTSGYFVYSQDREWITSTIKRRGKRILWLSTWSTMLYWFITVGYVVAKNNCFLGGDNYLELLRMALRFVFLQDVDFSGGGHLWFLWALLWSYIIVGFINRFNLWKQAHYSLPVLLVVMVMLSVLRSYYGWSWHSTGNAILGVTYVLIGHFIAARIELVKRLANQNLMIAIILGEILALATFLPMKYDFSQIGLIVAASAMFVYAINNGEFVLNRGLEVIGHRYSLYIYVFHILVNICLKKIEKITGVVDLTWFMAVHPVMVVLMTLLVAVVIERLIKRGKMMLVATTDKMH